MAGENNYLVEDFLRQHTEPVYAGNLGIDSWSTTNLFPIQVERIVNEGRGVNVISPAEIEKGLEGILNKQYISEKESAEKNTEYIGQALAIHNARLEGYTLKQIADFYGVKPYKVS